MDSELRILILEDKRSDAGLMEHSLKKDGMRFVSRVVDGKKSFLSELKGFAPDLILADYNVPGFGGPQAIEIVKSHNPYLPVILVTGTLDEVTAVDCIKAGAWDYVLKERLVRLAPAVRGALKMKEAMLEEKRA